MTENKDKPKTKGGLVSSVAAKLPNRSRRIVEASATSSTGSVSVTGDNHGSILNINAQNVILEQEIARELPSYLSKVVARFSEDLSQYNSGPQRSVVRQFEICRG